MRADLPSAARRPAADEGALAIDQDEAARLTRLSAKTLLRLADAGEPVGRVKIGRRVVFYLPALRKWLEARAAVLPAPDEPAPDEPAH